MNQIAYSLQEFFQIINDLEKDETVLEYETKRYVSQSNGYIGEIHWEINVSKRNEKLI